MIFRETKSGLLYEDSKLICLFGNKNSDIEMLKKEFPGLKFLRIKQTHSDTVVETKAGYDLCCEADAHFTFNAGQALCVNTADCIPILIFSEKSKVVVAIHAGWRGVENRILPKTLKKLKELGVDFKSLKIFIGPHICFESFEVGKDVKDLLEASANDPAGANFAKISDEKYKINLLELIMLQLKEFEIGEKQAQKVIRDTLSDLDFHSYRRDKEKSGRQISFITMK